MNPVILGSTITCPHCGQAETETMPTDACRFFYECRSCGTRLKPRRRRDCCVFCSYGSVKCPPVQQHQSCCGGLPIGWGAKPGNARQKMEKIGYEVSTYPT